MERDRLGRLGETAFWAVALAASLRFADLHVNMRRQNPDATLDKLIDGGAIAPFAERVLSPQVIGLISDISGLARPYAAAGLEVLALLALLWLFRATLQRRIASPAFTALASLAIFVPLMVHFLAAEYFRLWYPYDIPAVLGFAAFWYALERRSWIALYTIFVLATLNRETALFLAALPLLCLWNRMPLPRLLLHSLVLGLLWLALKSGIHMLVAPDALPFQIQIGSNLAALVSNPLDSLQIASVFAFAWVPVLLFNHRLDDDGLRRSLLLVPAWFAAMAVVANIHEIRVFAELIPLVWLAACLLAARSFGIGPPEASGAG